MAILGLTKSSGKMDGWNLVYVAPEELHPHPVSLEIYGEQVDLDKELIDSITSLGVLAPVRATRDLDILDGHTRVRGAIKVGLETIPILRCEHSLSPEEQVLQIVESNRQREKTNEQKTREYKKLAEAKAALAKKRQAHGKTAPGRTLGKKVSQATKSRAPKAKDEAASEIGVSRPTAEKMAVAVDAADEARQHGDHVAADKILDALNNQGAAAALRLVNTPPSEYSVEGARLITAKINCRRGASLISRYLGRAGHEINALADQLEPETAKWLNDLKRLLRDARKEWKLRRRQFQFKARDDKWFMQFCTSQSDRQPVEGVA